MEESTPAYYFYWEGEVREIYTIESIAGSLGKVNQSISSFMFDVMINIYTINLGICRKYLILFFNINYTFFPIKFLCISLEVLELTVF